MKVEEWPTNQWIYSADAVRRQQEVFIDLKRNQEGLYPKIKERRGRGSDGQVAQDMVMLPASDPQELEDLRDALDSALATAEDHVMKGWFRRRYRREILLVCSPASAGASWSTARGCSCESRRAWGSISGGSGTIAGSVSGSVTGSATGSTGGGYKTKGGKRVRSVVRAQWSLASSASDSGSKDPRDSSTTVFMSGLDPSTAWQEVLIAAVAPVSSQYLA